MLFLSGLVSAKYVNAQSADVQIRKKQWNAQWIAAPGDNGISYGVFYFRKNLDLAVKPTSFIVHVSADNRYKLYVNGTLVSLGPARGDTYYWNYETIDLAPYLSAGKNTVAALVWNEAQYSPAAQISVRTGFILQGNSLTEEILNTNNTWKCIRDTGHQPIPGFFFAASKGEMVDMNQTVKGIWTAVSYDDSTWPGAAKLLDGKLKGTAWGIDWALVPSTLPAREMTYQRIFKLRSAVG
ncbi:MAG: alpha-rhamnosidase, partial [Mucilaginibacter sp.]|nr:alpha-rhamnosidase [Mucilaginibacter sp.]